MHLRDVEPGDLPLFFEHQRDPEAVAMVVFRSRDRAEFDRHWAKILADDTAIVRTIVVESADPSTLSSQPSTMSQVAGNIVSFMRDGKREVGYWLDRTFWGRGIASEALKMFLQLEQTRPLYAGVAKHNVASLRVLQKCGFTFDPPAFRDPQSEIRNESRADDSHILLVLA